MSTNINNNKDIKYLNKDFMSFKQALIDFTKTYFPNTYNDFSADDPGTMFMEQASYIGDVLSFNLDNQIQENFIQYAKDKNNLLTLAYMFGYKPKVTTASTTNLDVFQLLPSKLVGTEYVPDFDYALILEENATVNSTSNISFITLNKVDFGFSSSFDPTDISVYQVNISTNNPEYYLIKKSVRIISGQIKSLDFSFGAPTRFPFVTLNDTNIIKILDVTDSDGKSWVETPYLAQETIFEEIQNIEQNDPTLYTNNSAVPYLLKLKRIPRRFVTRFKANNEMNIEFGSGLSNSFSKLQQILPQSSDETIIPNSDNVGLGLPEGLSKLDVAFNPTNFLFTEAYGISPYNTTLTFKYIVGGGISSNIPSNTINTLGPSNILSKSDNINQNLLTQIKSSIVVNNPLPAVGGGDGDSLEELRLNILSNFPSQLRAITIEDYIVRTMSLPPTLGTVAKVYVEQDQLLSKNDATDSIIDSNPLALSLYILSYNSNKQIVNSNIALKRNIKNFLSQYRMLTDAVTIKDAYYINISVNFDIMILPNFNNNEVLNNCIKQMQDFFDISKWQINQPILINDIYNLLLKVKGVQTVVKIDIDNLSGGNYSPFGYDIKSATKNNIIYPSLDPSIFEIRFSNNDIKGKIVTI
jgi:hypothetical protein